MKPKVSVIVPIYKVEKYLHRCVDSILKQSYKELEIILVNDGSPDQCGIIIEDYAENDHRIITVHKENGGLSDARNTGMGYVTGDFTLFVDSDDWIDSQMIERMVVASFKSEADIVQSGYYYAYDDHLIFDKRHFSKDESSVVLDKQELMKELVINEKIKNFAWGKLYKTPIIMGLHFEKGVVFEDVFWAHQVMHRANKYVILNKPLYYYYQREDSIVASYSCKSLDMIRGLKDRHRFVETHYQKLTDASLKVILKTCFLHYERLLMTRGIDNNGRYKKEIQLYIKTNYSNFIKAVETDQTLKNQLRLFAIHPSINVFFIYAKRVLRKIKVLPTKESFERIDLSERSEAGEYI